MLTAVIRYPLLSFPALIGLAFAPDGISLRLTDTVGRFSFDTPLATLHFDGNRTWHGSYARHLPPLNCAMGGYVDFVCA